MTSPSAEPAGVPDAVPSDPMDEGVDAPPRVASSGSPGYTTALAAPASPDGEVDTRA